MADPRPVPPRCPACETDPAPEPTADHIHLTDYGYLLYAPNHEEWNFVEEAIAEGRRRERADRG